MIEQGTETPAIGRPRVAVVGTFDTKGDEFAHLVRRIEALGGEPWSVDVGAGAPVGLTPDVANGEVARAIGEDVETLRRAGDREALLSAMGRGAARLLATAASSGAIHAVVALGGGGGTTIATEAFADLPIGFPKLLVSTVASGNIRPYLRGADVTVMYPVLDIAGLNPVTSAIVENAAAAVVGMAGLRRGGAGIPRGRSSVAVSAFGVTSAAVRTARLRLEERGHEVLVFHATGSGGESLEALARGGSIAGVLDLTTTELADELVGGVMSAGPDRLTSAGRSGIPQVVSVGAMDMVNLGPLTSVDPAFRDRRLIQHTSLMTLMRTNPDECAELGRRLARRLNGSVGPVAVFLPLRGVSAIAGEGGPFHDAVADAALFDAIRSHLSASIRLEQRDVGINDAGFATEMADALADMIAQTQTRKDMA